MPTYLDLRQAVRSYMNRDPTAFVIDGNDMLLRAVNNAKNFAQRATDFEYAKVFAQLDNVSLANGGNLDSSVLLGTSTLVNIKSVERAFISMSNGSGQFPIFISSRDAHVRRMRSRYETQITRNPESNQPASPLYPFAMVQYGKTIYLLPNSTTAFGGATATVYFDAIQWLGDYGDLIKAGVVTSPTALTLTDSGGGLNTGIVVGDYVEVISAPISATYGGTVTDVANVVGLTSPTVLALDKTIYPLGNETYRIRKGQPNFLLTNVFDFLLFRSIYELNFFLKEDQRVPISAKVLDEIWNNVLQWNATIVGNSTDDASLD